MDPQQDRRLGIIAGEGDLPLRVAREALARGLSPVAVVFSAESARALKSSSSALLQCGPGQVGRIIRFLHSQEVRSLVFVGKVDKRAMYRNPKVDWRAAKVARRLKDRRDDSLMRGVIEEAESEGFRVLPQSAFLPDLFPGPGVLSQRAPNRREEADLRFGFAMAKGVAALDLGQTVVVRDMAVVAAETIEGTDETIRRGCAIAGRGAVAVKVAKPGQDARFDVPVVGVETLRTLAEGGGTALGTEAGRTMVVGDQAFLEAARRWKIAVVSMQGEGGEPSNS